MLNIPWPFLAIGPRRPLFLADRLNCNWCPHRADIYFAARPTQARTCVVIHKRMSLLLQLCPECLVRLIIWFVRWNVRGHTAAFLWDIDSRICSKKHEAFLYSPYIHTYLYIYIYIYIYIYSECNGYRHRQWTRWLKFKFWTRLFALLLFGKVWIQLFFLKLWKNRGRH